MNTSRVAVTALSALLLTLAGCASGPKPVPYARPYPALSQKGSVNIQVFRRTTTVELTNTTARAFGPCTLWLNARFSRPIDGLKIGQSLTLAMSEFRDEHQDEFRGGGFFAAEIPERLVLAQIETTGDDGKPELVGLIVIGGEAE